MTQCLSLIKKRECDVLAYVDSYSAVNTQEWFLWTDTGCVEHWLYSDICVLFDTAAPLCVLYVCVCLFVMDQ